MDVISNSTGNSPFTRHADLVVPCLVAIGATLGTCLALTTTSAEPVHQAFGFGAACLAPVISAVLTRKSPNWIRRTAPALATLILGPPMGAEYSQALASAAIIFVLTGWLLEALKIDHQASPATDRLSLPIIGTSLMLCATPFALAQFLQPSEENLPLFVACLAAIAVSIPAALGWVAARLVIFIERRGVPALHHCRAEYLRAREAHK